MESWKLVCMTGVVALAGVAVGATVFGSHPAEAQQGPWRQCVVARQESVDVNGDSDIETPTRGHLINVPSGWEPVGGGLVQHNWVGAVVLCRR